MQPKVELDPLSSQFTLLIHIEFDVSTNTLRVIWCPEETLIERGKKSMACKLVLLGYLKLESKSNWFRIEYKNSGKPHAFCEAPLCTKV